MKTLHKHIFEIQIPKKVILKSMDTRVYRDVVLITPGEWSDSISRAPIQYTPETLRKYASTWSRNILNLDHDWKVLNIIGRVENAHWMKGAVRGDLYIDKALAPSEGAIAAIENDYVNALSVELLSDDKWDSEKQMQCADDIEFIGCAVIAGYPACEDARIK